MKEIRSTKLDNSADEKIRQFETNALEHTRLRPACQCLLTLSGVGVIPALAAKWSKAAYYIMKWQEAFDLSRVFG